MLWRTSKGSFWKKGLLAVAAAADMRRDSLEAEGVSFSGGVSPTDLILAVFFRIHSESLLPIFLFTIQPQRIHSCVIAEKLTGNKAGPGNAVYNPITCEAWGKRRL